MMTKSADLAAYVYVPQAARAAGIPRRWLDKMIAHGVVKTVQLPGARPLIRLGDVEQALNSLMEVSAMS